MLSLLLDLVVLSGMAVVLIVTLDSPAPLALRAVGVLLNALLFGALCASMHAGVLLALTVGAVITSTFLGVLWLPRRAVRPVVCPGTNNRHE